MAERVVSLTSCSADFRVIFVTNSEQTEGSSVPLRQGRPHESIAVQTLQLQGEKNRETYATRLRSSSTFSEHFSNPQPPQCGRRRRRFDRLRQHDVQAVILSRHEYFA